MFRYWKALTLKFQNEISLQWKIKLKNKYIKNTRYDAEHKRVIRDLKTTFSKTKSGAKTTRIRSIILSNECWIVIK